MSIKKKNAGMYTISVDGPMSLFKMMDKDGTSLVKLLPAITANLSAEP